MIQIIYLAAGYSTRFGQDKLLYNLNGKHMYLHGLDTLDEFCKTRDDCNITVVSRSKNVLDTARQRGMNAVFGLESEKGVSYSIESAINSLRLFSNVEYVMFVVADMPNISVKTLKSIADKADGSIKIVRACDAGKPANPVMFHSVYFDELINLRDDQGGRDLIQRYGCEFVESHYFGELNDIDTKDNLKYKNNVLITGAKKSGKTKLIKHMLKKIGKKYDGFFTEPFESYRDGSTYEMIQISTGKSSEISKRIKDERTPKPYAPIISAFDGFGTDCIAQAIRGECPIIVLDEIGRFEKNSKMFLVAVDAALDHRKTVFAAIKKEPLEHLEKLKKRPDVLLIDLDEVSFDDAEEILLENFRMKKEKQ